MDCTSSTGCAVFIVSDKFHEFGTNSGVFTYSTFLQAVRQNNPMLREVTAIVIGQGLDEARTAEIRRAAEACPLLAPARFFAPSDDRVDARLVHKISGNNTVITSPVKISQQEYLARLNISDQCAEMSDHITGHHVQGIVLIEVARQMMMASVELYALRSDERGAYSYVLNELAIQYYQYLFPLTAEIVLNLDRFDRDDKGQLSIDLTTTIFQANEAICSVKCRSHGYPKAKLAVMEARKAQQYVRSERKKWNEIGAPADARIALRAGMVAGA